MTHNFSAVHNLTDRSNIIYIHTEKFLGEEIKTPKLSRTGSSSRRSDVAEDLSESSTNNEEDNVFEELFHAVSNLLLKKNYLPICYSA